MQTEQRIDPDKNITVPQFGLPSSTPPAFSRWWVLLGTILAIGFLLALAGCTVTPVSVHSSQPSFDGNQQNSGLIGFNVDGSAIITVHAHDRYTNLLATFGTRLELPPKFPDEGMQPSYYKVDGTNEAPVWIMDAQHLNYFKRMNRWRKQSGR